MRRNKIVVLHIVRNMQLIVKRSVIVIYIRTTIKAVSVLRRKRKRFAVCKEQNKAVCGMVDPLIDPLKESIVML